MKNVGVNYRSALVDMVKATGKYLENHADELVDNVDLMTDFSMFIRFPQGEIPEIEIDQTHAMREVNKVIFGE